MNTYVADTHSLLWYMSNSPALGSSARKVFDKAEEGNAVILISAISLIEIIYLAEKKKISSEKLQTLINKIKSSINYVIVPVTFEIAVTIQEIKREKISDMPDRIIVATAISSNCKLITKDEAIRTSHIIETLW